MAQSNSPTTLEGNYKAIYGESPIFPIPESSVLQELLPMKKQKLGKSFQVPICVQDAQGASYGAFEDVVSLNQEIAMTLKNIEVSAAQIIMAASIGYSAAAASAQSTAAFMDGAGLVITNLHKSHSHKLECSLTYGRKGIGTVSSLNSQDIILTAASWSDGAWSSALGAKIDVYQSDNSTLRQGDLTVSAINPDNYTVTVTGTTTGIASGDLIYFDGAHGKECYGLDYIMTNTGSLFGVDAATYPAWKAQSYSAGSAPLSMSKVLAGAALANARGGLNEEAVLMVHPSSWNNLNADQASLVVQDPSKAQAQNGFNEIVYRGVSGRVRVISNPMVKRGEAFLFSPKNVIRVGACEITNQIPGTDGKLFFDSQTLGAHIVRTYSLQAIFAEKPAQMVKFTNIVPA